MTNTIKSTTREQVYEWLEEMTEAMSVKWDDINVILSTYGDIELNRLDTKDAWGYEWARNKYPLYKKFGNKLKITKEIENKIGQSEVLENFRETVIEELVRLSDKLSLEESENLFKYLKDLSVDELRSNRLDETVTISSNIKISKGAKISKSLKLLISDKEVLDKIQIAMSRFNESLLVRGTLEVSIDPIDILMMSQNATRDWKSCHNIFDGCYGAGAISYILDGASAIAQVVLSHKNKDENLTSSLIPDKVWRRMLMFNTDLDVAYISRSYPSPNKNNTDTLIELLGNTLSNGNYKHAFVDEDFASHTIENLNDCHYNDITAQALSKVYTIVFDPDKYKVTGENKQQETLRSLEGSTLSDLQFQIGGNGDVPSPHKEIYRFYINGDIGEGGVFYESDYDDYDDYDDYWD